jgi:hypothetical protein
MAKSQNKVGKKDETPLTTQINAPSVLDKNPAIPPGVEPASKEPSFTPSLFKAPMGKAKHERRIMDFQKFLTVINYRTHDDTLQKGHGQNLSGKG